MDFLLLPFLHVFQLFVVYPCIVCLFVRSLTLSLSLPHFLEWKTEAKSVHWVCNIYYGWWCGTECFVYFMYAQNNKQQTRKNLWCVIHVEGGMVAHTHERKKRVQRQKREIVRKNGIANDSKVERKGITFTYYIYVRIHFAILDPWPKMSKPYRKARNDENHECDISPVVRELGNGMKWVWVWGEWIEHIVAYQHHNKSPLSLSISRTANRYRTAMTHNNGKMVST